MAVDYDVQEFGNDREPVVVIDDFSADPAALRALAEAGVYTPNTEYYPGIRAPANANYLLERAPLLNAALETVFGVRTGLQALECNFSIVTTPPLGLQQPQRLPHVDCFHPRRLAVLHYLSPGEMGGTAYFRHKATGFEHLTDERYRTYGAILESEIAAMGTVPRRYPDETVPLFEKIGEVAARPNRLVIYRGNRFHSGVIPKDYTFDADPAFGRLTINTFLE